MHPGAARRSVLCAQNASRAGTARKPAAQNPSPNRREPGFGLGAEAFGAVHRRDYRLPAVRWALLFLCCLPTAGCARCSPSSGQRDSGPPAPLVFQKPLPPPKPWTFELARPAPDVAYPEQCKARAPLVRASVAPSSRFVADPHTLASLVVADATGDPPALTGVAALRLDPAGVSTDPRPVPWFDAAALPHMARTGGGFLAAVDRTASSDERLVVLAKHDGAELLGGQGGDGFEAIDLACLPGDDGRCAVLTTRLLPVARPGATLWRGSAREPAASWKPTDLLPPEGTNDAKPVGLAGVEAGPSGIEATAILLEKGELVFRRVSDAGETKVAALPSPFAVIDALASPAPIAITQATEVDEEGCPVGGLAGIHLLRAGKEPLDLRSPAPPAAGYLRKLRKGGLVAWLSPLGCKQGRKVVFAAVLDEKGAPTAPAMTVGDATSFAVAASGDDVDLWLQAEGLVTWIRMTCSPP